MARFAGGSEFMDAYNAVASSGLNLGALGAAAQASQSKQRSNAMLQQARLKYAGDKAEVIEAGGDARADMYGAQGDSAFMGNIMGGVRAAGGAIAGGITSGAFNKGPGTGTGPEFGEVGTTGSDMASFGYTPEQDKLFHSGAGIDYGYL